MPTFAKPRVVVSQCLGFAACRYNGARLADEFVARLKAHVDFRPVCPEMAIGLGCPRDPIRVVKTPAGSRLVQPATGRDVTDAMREFAARFLDGVGEVDGFILKARSPSCGIKDVKVYARADSAAPVAVGRGFFGGAVLERFAGAAIEDEGRLNRPLLGKRFLTKLFARAALREGRIKDQDLRQQASPGPYPPDLLDIRDSGKARGG
jgi:uncharacterized protein YbbK (DUF523 family)